MVRWFCPYCWNEVDERDEVCPHCGADLKGFSSLDYDKKLIFALDFPIRQRVPAEENENRRQLNT